MRRTIASRLKQPYIAANMTMKRKVRPWLSSYASVLQYMVCRTAASNRDIAVFSNLYAIRITEVEDVEVVVTTTTTATVIVRTAKMVHTTWI